MRGEKFLVKAGFGIVFLAFTLVVAEVPSVYAAKEYPSKPIQLIVPWSAGGGSDAIGRVIAHFASQHFDQPMVVVNVPGVSGTLGARQGKEARPDGYTLTLTHQSVITSRLVGVSDFDYGDFIPLVNFSNTPNIIAARPDAPWNDVKELVADAKKNPGTITFGATLGSSSHFFPLEVAYAANIDFKIVGYEGTAKRQAALLGKFIDLGESNPASGKKYFAAKRLKPLGIATEKRHPLLPEVPTLKEQGVDVVGGTSRGVCAPLGTPPEIIAKLSAVFEKMANDPQFIKKFEGLGTDVMFLDQEAYKEFVEKETKKYEFLAREFDIMAQ